MLQVPTFRHPFYIIVIHIPFSFLSFPLLSFFFVLPVSHHIPHAAIILRRQLRLQLLPRQPLEVCVSKGVALEVGLASHDPALEEEGLAALLLDLAGGAEDGLLHEVGDGDAADEPGVHVDAGSLVHDSLCALFFNSC